MIVTTRGIHLIGRAGPQQSASKILIPIRVTDGGRKINGPGYDFYGDMFLLKRFEHQQSFDRCRHEYWNNCSGFMK
jgi:hypothetical protein